MKSLSGPDLSRDAARARFARWLWRAFPARSADDLARRAAPVLGCTERQVRNWLACENDASLRFVLRVLVVMGGEAVITRIEGGG